MARGKSPFRYENMWLKTDGFVDRVDSWWNRNSFSGTPSYVFAKRLKALKEDIIQWNRQEFGNVNRQKKELLGALELLDAKEGVLGLTETEINERNGVRSQVEHLLSLEDGDKNRGCFVSRRVIIILSSSIRWLILIEGITI